MDKSEAIVTVDDAIRKLKQLNSKEKIWAQEMLLQVNDKSIRLLDCETQVSMQIFNSFTTCWSPVSWIITTGFRMGDKSNHNKGKRADWFHGLHEEESLFNLCTCISGEGLILSSRQSGELAINGNTPSLQKHFVPVRKIYLH